MANEFWDTLQPFRGKMRTNGKNGKERRFYEWDYTHEDIEVYDQCGRHIGSANPKTGDFIKPQIKGRLINL